MLKFTHIALKKFLKAATLELVLTLVNRGSISILQVQKLAIITAILLEVVMAVLVVRVVVQVVILHVTYHAPI